MPMPAPTSELERDALADEEWADIKEGKRLAALRRKDIFEWERVQYDEAKNGLPRPPFSEHWNNEMVKYHDKTYAIAYALLKRAERLALENEGLREELAELYEQLDSDQPKGGKFRARIYDDVEEDDSPRYPIPRGDYDPDPMYPNHYVPNCLGLPFAALTSRSLQMDIIHNLPYETMARFLRFGPSDHVVFQDEELFRHLKYHFNLRGGWTTEISKRIGSRLIFKGVPTGGDKKEKA